jgi:hypothetical protein
MVSDISGKVKILFVPVTIKLSETYKLVNDLLNKFYWLFRLTTVSLLSIKLIWLL